MMYRKLIHYDDDDIYMDKTVYTKQREVIGIQVEKRYNYIMFMKLQALI